MRKTIALGAGFLVALGVGGSVGYSWGTAHIIATFAEAGPIRQRNNPYAHINPLLGYELPEAARESKEYVSLRRQLEDYIKRQTEVGQVKDVSVYFRDLNKGRWVGVNTKTTYAPASLLKVVIMMAYLKDAEINPSVLSRRIVYSVSLAKEITEVPFETPSYLKVGNIYSVQQLIEAMIIHSDNGAKNILLDNLTMAKLDQIYSDLGIQNPQNNGGDDYQISAQKYSVFLRILYNSTYLSRAMSENALGIMAKAEYPDGLVAGLPAGTGVAQKFGEHIYTDSTGNPTDYDLSDCGVVYHPSQPYIICVMTRGDDVQALARVISNISSIVYQAADSGYGEQK